MLPKYPYIQVELPDDGNVLGIIARVHLALRRAGVPEREINAYNDAARAGDYPSLLLLTSRTVHVVNPAGRDRAA